MKVFLNGKILAADQANIAYDDAGLQHGVGLFETMSAHGGKIFRLQEHLERLAKSAVMLGLVRKLEVGPLAQAVNMTLAANELADARIRLTLTAGSLSLLKPTTAGQPEPLPTVMIVVSPATVYDPAFFERGVRVLIAPVCTNPLDPLTGHKTLSYWSRLRTLRQAASVGAHEALWMSITGHVVSGAISNLFILKDDTLYTPYARGEEVPRIEGNEPSPAQGLPEALPGVVRAAVIELAEILGVAVQRKMLTVEDVLAADEVFLTNSGWYVLPVTQVDKSDISHGEVGEITQRLLAELREQLV
ncbi:MAG: hypothetical protein HC898_09820 [Phycisphaerales bacterium]|nr:hypothetical protein [Phycisphaerales bacterium]